MEECSHHSWSGEMINRVRKQNKFLWYNIFYSWISGYFKPCFKLFFTWVEVPFLHTETSQLRCFLLPPILTSPLVEDPHTWGVKHFSLPGNTSGSARKSWKMWLRRKNLCIHGETWLQLLLFWFLKPVDWLFFFCNWLWLMLLIRFWDVNGHDTSQGLMLKWVEVHHCSIM